MRLMIFIFMLAVASLAVAQDGVVLQRHKFYDTTVVEDYEKVHRRRLTTEVDSTGVTLWAWGSECYLKINLLQRMAVNANFYETDERNGRPYMMYGNNQYRFRMYVNRHDRFEFDGIIRSRPASGRYFFPFDIETQGLNFYYQGPLTAQDYIEGNTRPPEVVGSYAVYHKDHDEIAGSWTVLEGPDTSYYHYGIGKATHIRRPKAWDADGDTVWGFIDIDTILGRMRIGADSTWMANATFPVTIDPDFGTTDSGLSVTLVGDNTYGVRMATASDAASANLDSISINWASVIGGNCDANCSTMVALYSDDSGNEWPEDNLTETSRANCQDVEAAGTGWLVSVDGDYTTFALGASTTYWVVILSNEDNNTAIGIAYDDPDDAANRRRINNVHIASSWPTMIADDSNDWLNLGSDEFILSIFGSYTVAGGAADISFIRRIKEGEGK